MKTADLLRILLQQPSRPTQRGSPRRLEWTGGLHWRCHQPLVSVLSLPEQGVRKGVDPKWLGTAGARCTLVYWCEPIRQCWTPDPTQGFAGRYSILLALTGVGGPLLLCAPSSSCRRVVAISPPAHPIPIEQHANQN